MNVETEIGSLVTELSLQDLRALRNADDLVFQYYDRQGEIRAIKRGNSNLTGFDQEHHIYTGSSLTDYRPTATEYRAFYMKHVAQYSGTMRTLIGRLRKGDRLQLLWTRNNDCESILAVGFHQDELRLVVHRGARTETYLVAVAVGPDNTARMVRTFAR